MDAKSLLDFAIGNGMLDINSTVELYDKMERQRLLKLHTGKIWQGKDGKWRTHLQMPDGKRKLVSRATKEAVEDAIVEFYEENNSSIKFKEAFEGWVTRQRNLGRSDNTIYHYQADYRRFFKDDEFELLDVTEITDEIICIFIKRKLENIKMPYSSLKGMFGYIRGVMDKAVRDKIITDNPCKYVDLIMFKKLCVEKDKTSANRTLSDEEIEKLINKLMKSYKEKPQYIPQYAIELTIHLGLRVSELAALKWEDIDSVHGVIKIRRSEKFNRLTKEYFIDDVKNHKERELPMTSEIQEILDRIKNVETKNGYLSEWVFSDENGRVNAPRISECIRNRTMGKEFDSTKSIHAIRRTFNSKLRCMGVSTVVAASMLGHTVQVNENNYTYDVASMDYKKKVMNEVWRKAE